VQANGPRRLKRAPYDDVDRGIESCERLRRDSMGDDMFIATPAVAGNSMYLRGQNTLYCIRRAN
jgi:hypothetical protein